MVNSGPIALLDVTCKLCAQILLDKFGRTTFCCYLWDALSSPNKQILELKALVC